VWPAEAQKVFQGCPTPRLYNNHPPKPTTFPLVPFSLDASQVTHRYEKLGRFASRNHQACSHLSCPSRSVVGLETSQIRSTFNIPPRPSSSNLQLQVVEQSSAATALLNQSYVCMSKRIGASQHHRQTAPQGSTPCAEVFSGAE
jgi:hypothetical protein